MRIFRDFHAIPADARGATAAIGNFDGVHRGHRAVIETARKAAPDAALGVVTFEPHPREVFVPDAPPFRLTGAAARASRLRKLGVDTLFELPFGPALSTLTDEAFARDVLARGLGLSHVVVGADFCFGKGRRGNAASLQRYGAEYGFGVTIAPLLAAGGAQVSSTAIRAAIAEGRPRDAADLLGHWHRIEGPVEHGEKRGRDLGYPTANMSIDGLHLPRFGVYAVLVDVQDGPHAGRYHGAASVGVRPMFGENRPNIETYIFDFQGDLYGAQVSVGLVAFLRPELKFDGIDALIDQMALDCTEARAILEAL